MMPLLLLSTMPTCPRGLIYALINDRTRGDVPAVQADERPDVEAWLCYIGVEWDALVGHVKLLETWLPDDAFGDPLPPEVVAAVRARGPAGIDDETVLAGLLLNANQLIQLHETAYGDGPDESGPSDFWLDVIDRVAKLDVPALAAGTGAGAHALLAHEGSTQVAPAKPGHSMRLLGFDPDTDGEALRAEIIARCYGPEADLDEPFALTLHAQSVPGDADRVRLHLTASPAPVLAPLELTLTFAKLPDAPAVTFVIPACGEGRPKASSGSSEPLPRVAFEFEGGTWERGLPLRLTVRGGAS